MSCQSSTATHPAPAHCRIQTRGVEKRGPTNILPLRNECSSDSPVHCTHYEARPALPHEHSHPPTTGTAPHTCKGSGEGKLETQTVLRCGVFIHFQSLLTLHTVADIVDGGWYGGPSITRLNGPQAAWGDILQHMLVGGPCLQVHTIPCTPSAAYPPEMGGRMATASVARKSTGSVM